MGSVSLAWGMPGTTELVIIAGIALLVFGRRLPDVARSVGKSIVEFKKGLKDVKTDIDVQSRLQPPAQQSLDQKPAGTVSPPASQESGESASNAEPSAATPDVPTESGSPPSQ